MKEFGFSYGKALKVLCLFALIFALFVPSVMADEEELTLKHLESPKAYIKYLQKYNVKEARRLGVEREYAKEAVKETKQFIKDFKKLSREEQYQMLDEMKSVSSFTLQEEKTEEIEVNKVTSIKKNVVSIASVNSRRVEHTFKMGAWTHLNVSGVYEYNSKGATKALGARGHVTKNWNPLVVVTANPKCVDWVNSGEYNAEAVFNYSIGPIEGLALQLGTVKVVVYGDEDGKTGGWGRGDFYENF